MSRIADIPRFPIGLDGTIWADCNCPTDAPGRMRHTCHKPGEALWFSFDPQARPYAVQDGNVLTRDELDAELPGHGIPCVYALFEDFGTASWTRGFLRPVYVGQSIDVPNRLMNHYQRLPGKASWVPNMSLALACIIPCRSTAEMNAVEAAEITRLRPALNREGIDYHHSYTRASERAEKRRSQFRVISSEVPR